MNQGTQWESRYRLCTDDFLFKELEIPMSLFFSNIQFLNNVAMGHGTRTPLSPTPKAAFKQKYQTARIY